MGLLDAARLGGGAGLAFAWTAAFFGACHDGMSVGISVGLFASALTIPYALLWADSIF